MQKLKLLVVRLLLTVLLSCSLFPSMPAHIQDETAQPVITVQAAASYNKATIKKVQKKLNKRGYDCGTPDGVRGRKTTKAIKQYQEDHELKVTGTVNASLLESLHVKAVKDEAPSISQSSSVTASDTNELTVYITDTGSKYHRDGCRYLSRSKHAISLSDAQSRGYDACSVCRP